ncbi:hypothetical protein [Spirillospora sp. NPDC029432]|uniref:hypothetical protein n=1 Tax=Spirillospora sp. NPDC029432 TaxID=3154599 RepID=UPI0034531970
MRTTNPRADLGFRQLAGILGLAPWQLRLALEHGLVPAPDADGRWPAGTPERCPGGAQIIEAFGEEPPIGAGKAAARLALRLALDVERADIEVLVARGDLTVAGRYRRHPIYLLRDLDALDAGVVRDVVATRKGPLLDSVDAKGAALVLGWPKGLFDDIAAERSLPADQLGRYHLADVRALAADGALAERARADLRHRALARARRDEERHEDALRNWMLRCTAYLDRAADDPPDPAAAGRTLRALRTARAAPLDHP